MPKDADDLQKKMKDVTAKKDQALKLFNDLDKAGKGLDNIEKKYGSIPPAVSENLSKLTDVLSAQATQMESLNTFADHQSYDNTICEYLVMTKEACAAFTTFTNFYAKGSAILINLASDKAAPAAAANAGSAMDASDNTNMVTKEVAKLFTASKLDEQVGGEGITTGGFTEDISRISIEVFLKKYCVVMSGDLQHDYQCTFRNMYNNVWWQYNYTTEATISLRYPRNNQGGNIIKMKGNIEGNATKFNIYQKASEIDEFREAMKTLQSFILYYCMLRPVCLLLPVRQIKMRTLALLPGQL